jgi:UDP-N-acetylglucosamine:LPS N-acetylglucosamine transferase
MRSYFWLVEHSRPNDRNFLYAYARPFIKEFLDSEKPDILLSVHPMLNHFAQRFIKEHRYEIPCHTFVTDPFPPFWRGWASPYVDRYFVPTTEALETLVGMGVPAGRIERVPMPVRSQFRPSTVGERQAFRKEFELDQGPLILVNGGARGGGPLTTVYRSVRTAAPDANIVVVCGQNPRLQQRIRSLNDLRTRTFGFVQDIERYIGAADLVLTKPGGMATYETLACGVPLMLLGFGGLMPQESGTFHAASRYKFGHAAGSLAEVESIIRAGPAQWNQFRDSQARFYCSSSGQELIERIHPNHVHV